MKNRKVSFEQALNDAIREGATASADSERFSTATSRMGVPAVDLDRAIQLAGDLEDDALLRKIRAGS